MIKMLICFSLVGLSGVGVNMAVYMYLTGLSVHYLAAAVVSFVGAVTNNFIWNMVWTFKGRAKDKSVKRKYLSFFAISTVSLGINLLVLKVLVEYVLLSVVTAQLAAIMIVSSLNFCLNYLITFGEKPDKHTEGGRTDCEVDCYTHL